MVMTMKIINKIISVTAMTVIISGAVFAQDGERVLLGDISLRAGPRGLILIIDGTGPMTVDVPPAVTGQYRELRVTVNGGRVDGGRRTYAPPGELPVAEIAVEETRTGALIVASMRGTVSGPVDLRGGGTNQVRIMLTRDPQPEINWTTASDKAQTAAAAGEIKTAPVDIKKMEERAVKDAQAPAGGDMFSVKGSPSQQPRRQAAASASATGAPQIAQKTETPPPQVEPAPSGIVTKETPEGELVRYRVYGRDPFVPLVRDTSGTGLPRVENLRLVGVLEDARERIALVEDFKNGNRAFALRANDAVEQGKVLRVQRDRVVFLIRDFDVSRSYTLSLSTDR